MAKNKPTRLVKLVLIGHKIWENSDSYFVVWELVIGSGEQDKHSVFISFVVQCSPTNEFVDITENFKCAKQFV